MQYYKHLFLILVLLFVFILNIKSVQTFVLAGCSGTYQCCDSTYTDNWCSGDHSIDCVPGDINPCPPGKGPCVEHTVCDGESIVSCSGTTKSACENPSNCPNSGQTVNSSNCTWSCTPDCTGKSCGDDDGCGGKCDVDSSCGTLGTCDDSIYTCVCQSGNICSYNDKTGVCPGGASGWVCETQHVPANGTYPNCCNYQNQCADGSSECCNKPKLATPQNLTSTGINDAHSVKLTWNVVSTDVDGNSVNNTDVKGYLLQVSQDGTNWNNTGECDGISTAGQSTTTCTDTIDVGVSVYYRIAANGDCPGDSDWSAPVQYVPMSCNSLNISLPSDPGNGKLYIGDSTEVTASIIQNNAIAPFTYNFYSENNMGEFNPASDDNIDVTSYTTTYKAPSTPGKYTLYFNATDTNGAKIWDSVIPDSCKAEYDAVYKNEEQAPNPAVVSCSFDQYTKDLTFSWSHWTSVVDHPTDSERVDPYEPAVGFCEPDGTATGNLAISCSKEPYWWQVSEEIDNGSVIYNIYDTSDLYATSTTYTITKDRFYDEHKIRLDHAMIDARANGSSIASAKFHAMHDNQPPKPVQNMTAQYYNDSDINNSIKYTWEWTGDNTCSPTGNGTSDCYACEDQVGYCTWLNYAENDSSISCDSSVDGPFQLEVWDMGDWGYNDASTTPIYTISSTGQTSLTISCDGRTDHWLELRIKTRDARGNTEPEFSTIKALCNNTAPKCVDGINSNDSNFNNGKVGISQNYNLNARGEDTEKNDVYFRWTQSAGGGYTVTNGVDQYTYENQYTTWTSPNDEYDNIQLTFDVGDARYASGDIVYNGTSCVKYVSSCDLNFSSKQVDPTSINVIEHSSTQITLTWSPVQYADEYQIDVSKNGAPFVNVGTVTDTRYTYNYTDNVDYTFRITAKDTSPSACNSSAKPTEYTVDALVGTPPSCSNFVATYNSQTLQNDDVVPPNAEISLSANVTDKENDPIDYSWESSTGASFADEPVSPNTATILAPYSHTITNTYTMPDCGQSPEIYLNLRDNNNATSYCAIRLQTNSCGTSMDTSLTDGSINIQDSFPVSTVAPNIPVYEYTIYGGTSIDTGTARVLDEGICAESYVNCYFEGHNDGDTIILPNNTTTPDGTYNVIVTVTSPSSSVINGNYPLRVASTFAGTTYYAQSNINVTRSGDPYTCNLTRDNEGSEVVTGQDVNFHVTVNGSSGTLSYTWSQDNTSVGNFTSTPVDSANETYHTNQSGDTTITVSVYDNVLNSTTSCSYVLNVGSGWVYPGAAGNIWFDYNKNSTMEPLGYMTRHEVPGSGWYKPIDASGNVGYLFGCCFISKTSDNGTPSDTSDDFEYYELQNCDASDPYGTAQCVNPDVPFADISGANSPADNLTLTTTSRMFGDQIYNEADGGNNYYYTFRYDEREPFEIKVEMNNPQYEAFKVIASNCNSGGSSIRQTYNEKGEPDELGHIIKGTAGVKNTVPNTQDICIGLAPIDKGKIFVETYKVNDCSDPIYSYTDRLPGVQIYLDSVDRGTTDSNGELVLNNVPIDNSATHVVTATSSTYTNCDTIDNSENVQVTDTNIEPTVQFKFVEKREDFIVINQGNFTVLNAYSPTSMTSNDAVISHSGSLIINGNINLGSGKLESDANDSTDNDSNDTNKVYDLPNYDNTASLDISALINSTDLQNSYAVEYVNGDITASNFYNYVDKASGDIKQTKPNGDKKHILMVNGSITVPYDASVINALIIANGNMIINENTSGADIELTINGGLLINGDGGITNNRKTKVYVNNNLDYLRDNDLEAIPVTRTYIIKYE